VWGSDTPTAVKGQKHGIKQEVVKISIQNKGEPRITKCQAQVKEPRKNGHNSSLVSNREEKSKKNLNGKQRLLIPRFA
jgi:hypothetical protein